MYMFILLFAENNWSFVTQVFLHSFFVYDIKDSIWFLFTECESLIKQMLTVDPSKRITIDQILNHEWVRAGEEDPEFDELISYSRSSNVETEELNENILSHMENLGLDREMTEKVRWLTAAFFLCVGGGCLWWDLLGSKYVYVMIS